MDEVSSSVGLGFNNTVNYNDEDGESTEGNDVSDVNDVSGVDGDGEFSSLLAGRRIRQCGVHKLQR